MKKIIILMLAGVLSALYATQSYYKNHKLVELEHINISRSVNSSNINFYKNRDGQQVGIKDEILVQCKKGISCSSLFIKFNIMNYSKLTDKIFIIKVADYDNIFSLSRKLFESGDVEFAHPNFIKERKKR
ncbi:MAG: hypothetical protein U9N33_06685 [Campylobacterota bacterium]|nr:hypothetical protein [Campylobacterota bacterium]